MAIKFDHEMKTCIVSYMTWHDMTCPKHKASGMCFGHDKRFEDCHTIDIKMTSVAGHKAL